MHPVFHSLISAQENQPHTMGAAAHANSAVYSKLKAFKARILDKGNGKMCVLRVLLLLLICSS